MPIRFEDAIGFVLNHEGLLSDHPADPGGITKYGISLRFLQDLPPELGDINHDGAVNSEDVRGLTIADALRLYRTQWWEPYLYDEFDSLPIAQKVFDYSVNMGPKMAHRILQRGLRACGCVLPEDGILGPVTFRAAASVSVEALLVGLRCEAAGFYRSLNKPEFIAGWLNRAYA